MIFYANETFFSHISIEAATTVYGLSCSAYPFLIYLSLKGKEMEALLEKTDTFTDKENIEDIKYKI